MTIVERLTTQGILRRGTPHRGFRYVATRGSRVSRADRARIQALRIPPAWTEVAIHVSPAAAVQAVGRDRAGRWQYLYHASQVARRERRKRERLGRFIRGLPALRRIVARDPARTGFPRARVAAGPGANLEASFSLAARQGSSTSDGKHRHP